MQSIPKTNILFDLSKTMVGSFLSKYEYPFEILPNIDEIIREYISLHHHDMREIYQGIYLEGDACISEKATLIPPCIIGRDSEIRPGAYIRGKAIIGRGAVIGNSSEIKNSIIFDEAKLPHYNYLGDSIIGYKAHMGAGAIASNLRLDGGEITIGKEKNRINSGLRKVGAFIGDHAEIGCGAVICPGSVIGKRAKIYPLVRVNGIINNDMIYDGRKERGNN